ncbi:MAG TPA: hypothetical protein PLJ27_08545 [Polyangiaceae bacterium]|jgi:hypothetical protein|nr:MAG: hypothetical protein BWY17_01867 [Deltaproteobacteria bacterium ADurb.Bin207]HNS95318.1 hypothetical protein [Polyangiaceae bacterium]HNZ23154.1 hypothetical protein [Polyangiaceae bacterium]HOD22114.1 hypothetical protein [Polyangiaceae bacterium]HOE50888.1 hypothetical protein [Polyangiaceae bacterium]
MAEKNDKGGAPETKEKYETPWAMLAIFGVIFLGIVLYGFFN